MASASATPSSRYLQLIEGNSEGEHRPVPSTIARDRSLEWTSGNYKRRGNRDTTKVPLYERVKQFPGENLIARERKLFCSGCREIISSMKSVLKSWRRTAIDSLEALIWDSMFPWLWNRKLNGLNKNWKYLVKLAWQVTFQSFLTAAPDKGKQ